MATVTVILHNVPGRRCVVCHGEVLNLRECDCWPAHVEDGRIDVLERRIDPGWWSLTVDTTWVG